MGIHPVFLGIADFSCKDYILRTPFFLDSLQFVIVLAIRLSADIEFIFRKELHHRNQSLEILLGSGLTDGKEELLVVFDVFRLLLQLQIRIFDAIINHIQWFIAYIDMVQQVIFYIFRDDGDIVRTSDMPFHLPEGFQAMDTFLLVQEVEVMDSQDVLHPLFVFALDEQLVCGMPQINFLVELP